MSEPLRLLLVEDSPVDAELNERELRKAGLAFVTTRVEEEAALVAALEDFRPDLILADYHLPGFDGLRALAICRERMPATPLSFVTRALGEGLAVRGSVAPTSVPDDRYPPPAGEGSEPWGLLGAAFLALLPALGRPKGTDDDLWAYVDRVQTAESRGARE